MKLFSLVAILTVATATVLPAQKQFSVEFTPVKGTIGLGATSGSVVRGAEVGFGFSQIDHTLSPGGSEDLEDFLHLAAFQRMSLSPRWTLDARIQLGLAELNGCSGCIPGLLSGVSVGLFGGGRRVKFGPRLTTGVLWEGRSRTFVMNVTPIAAQVTF